MDPPGTRRPGDEEMQCNLAQKWVQSCDVFVNSYTGGEDVEKIFGMAISTTILGLKKRHLWETGGRLNFRAVLDEPPANFRGFIQDLEEGDPEDIPVDSLWKGCGKAEK